MKLLIEGKEYEYCPQHGYPLPCDKCGLGQYELGRQDGIKEVVNWINSTHLKKTVNYNEPNLIIPLRYWNSKLKEWRI